MFDSVLNTPLINININTILQITLIARSLMNERIILLQEQNFEHPQFLVDSFLSKLTTLINVKPIVPAKLINQARDLNKDSTRRTCVKKMQDISMIYPVQNSRYTNCYSLHSEESEKISDRKRIVRLYTKIYKVVVLSF